MSEISYTHHKQRIKDYKNGVRMSKFKLEVCGNHQVKRDKLKEKHKNLTEKLEQYLEEAIEAGFYELVI